jgi:splicing factor 3A subunit 1
MATEEEFSKAIQGRVTGVIIPPPEIRAVADKTAQFVAKNGKSFEQKILASADGKTPKFNFMKIMDPYHAYYEMKIRYERNFRQCIE